MCGSSVSICGYPPARSRLSKPNFSNKLRTLERLFGLTYLAPMLNIGRGAKKSVARPNPEPESPESRPKNQSRNPPEKNIHKATNTKSVNYAVSGTYKGISFGKNYSANCDYVDRSFVPDFSGARPVLPARQQGAPRIRRRMMQFGVIEAVQEMNTSRPEGDNAGAELSGVPCIRTAMTAADSS
jgi:hypothetical protein